MKYKFFQVLTFKANSSIKSFYSVIEHKFTYWFQLIQWADTAHSHVRELHSDSALWGDASHSALSKLIMHDLASKAQTTIDSSNHSQHSHEAPHFRVLRVRKVVL